jgi:hypothetical protein
MTWNLIKCRINPRIMLFFASFYFILPYKYRETQSKDPILTFFTGMSLPPLFFSFLAFFFFAPFFGFGLPSSFCPSELDDS